ncbi:uncharacterized protein LOC134215691 [Armigeres subalbatus]|uniref:uncharacterized protein LOC134215691 n=1 Tax=Armigeres subalbatus TaxID=124917 RepID=UPI002ED14722
MEDDVICLDSDDEGGETGRKLGKPSGDSIDEQLLRPLQSLSLELYFGGVGGGTTPVAPYDEQWRRSTAVVKRVAELVQRFGRQKFSNDAQDVARQRDAWKQVLKFLFLLRAIGPESMANDNQQQRQHSAEAGSVFGPSAMSGSHQKELPPETRRYRLTVMDVLVDYIRYKCSALAGERNPAVLLAQCNQIVSSLYIIFDGDSEFVTLTLLKMDLLAGSGAVALMYPVFEQILASQARCTGAAASLDIMDYVRLLLCYKKWKAMVPARRDKDAISALALKVLPPRCPQAKTKQDLAFVQMLPRVSASAKEQEDETRFLLAKDLMEIEQLCAIYFREYEKRFFQRNVPKASPLESKSNFINIDALAEFIQRKCNLLKLRRLPPTSDNEAAVKPAPSPGGKGQRQQLQHETNAIISSLRLIFRRDEEFIALTLLRVETCPDCQAILGPVYERFLACPQQSSSSNNVESYGRLLLCYVKWKRLYRAEDPGGYWARIDAIALAKLPYDFPRAIKRRELEIKALFPRVATASGRRRGRSSKVSVTRALLNSKHVLDNVQEMCLQFLAICRDGRTNREKAQPIPSTLIIEDDVDSNDDDVKLIKPEPSSVLVLDSEDEELNRIIGYTDTEMKCSTLPYPGNNASFLPDISTASDPHENLLMDTIFNTPPPTPKADEDHQLSAMQLPPPTTQAVPSEAAPSVIVAPKLHKQKSILPRGVNFKISKNVRLHSCRERRQFLTAFRRLSSEQCFHINVSSGQADYCLRKTVANSTVFVEIISFADSSPLAMPILLPPVARIRSELDETATIPTVELSPSCGLVEPLLQKNALAQSTRMERTLDDQLMKLLMTIDDFPQLSPASVDFAVFPEVLDPTSIDFLINTQTPPSSVVTGCCLWPNDDFSVFANLDLNSWLEHENATSPTLSPLCASRG